VVVGRFFRGLTAYDLLGNLVPGVILLTASLLFLPDGWLPSSIGGSALFALFAYLLGGAVQVHASYATGDREDFERSIDTDGQVKRVNRASGTSNGPNNTGSGIGQLLRQSFLHPVSGGPSEKRGRPVEDQVLASQIQQHIYNEHNIEPGSASLSVLYRLMMSEVDASDTPPTAIRMQALRNLYRGVWIAVWYVVLLLSAALAVRHGLLGCEFFRFLKPGYYQLWSDLWQLLLLGFGAVVMSRHIYERRNRDFVEYLFTNYAATVSLPDDATAEPSTEAAGSQHG
jgi:hypothetical protein